MSGQEREGYARLLDAWAPPADAGEPVGCAATSFTFSPAFFEEECVARFLGLESDPQEDGAIYLIEREEKLNSTSCVAALVDARHCRGRRSLRWDLLPVRVPGAVLHAKIALLGWQHAVRLIVASANLTEDGYRRNQEVFGVLDYYDGCSAASETLRETIGFLREAAGYADTEGSPPIERWHRLLDWAKGRADDWGQGRPPKAERVAAVFVGPGRPSAMKQLQEVWPGRSPPSAAYVVSPFFDPPAPRNGPAESLWELLRRKGEATVTYHVTAEETTEADRLLAHAPKSLRGATPGRHNVATCFARVQENDLPGKERLSFRPLHAKSLWLENDNWVSFMVGSSNFTTPGLGLGRSPNLEANLVYLASYAQTPERVDALDSARLHGQELEDGQVQGWEPRVDETQSDPEGPPQLPAQFATAVLRMGKRGGHEIELTFKGEPPEGWVIYPEERKVPIYTESAWTETGRPAQIVIEWAEDLPPTGLEVSWDGARARAWWPINIADAHALPPPDELRGLSLDALIHILTSARPLKDALRQWMQRQRRLGTIQRDENGEPLDPHKRVDTSGFLLQRTRRVSWALAGLRERLERPVPTRQALEWRVHGPVGVRQVARALEQEQRSSEEYAFLMAELVLELARVRPRTAEGCLSPREVRQVLGRFIDGVRSQIEAAAADLSPATRGYVEQALSQADSAARRA